MYTLKGIFPEPKKDQRRNFIKENMKQLKYMQGKSKDGAAAPPAGVAEPPRRSGVDAGRAGGIRKGDVAEFVRRKPSRARAADVQDAPAPDTGRREVGCQTAPPDTLTVLYPAESAPPGPPAHPAPAGDAAGSDAAARARLAAILDRKKDPYLPAGYRKGEVPKYLQERNKPAEAGEGAPPAGHVRLPDAERRDTLRTLRASFAELVRELNALPVRADTLRAKDHKRRLEAQLARLEDGIKVFSRPAVYVKVHD